jgi:hypothetical protein
MDNTKLQDIEGINFTDMIEEFKESILEDKRMEEEEKDIEEKDGELIVKKIISNNEIELVYEYQATTVVFNNRIKDKIPELTKDYLIFGDDRYKYLIIGTYTNDNIWKWGYEIVIDDEDNINILKNIYEQLPKKYQTPPSVQFGTPLALCVLLSYIKKIGNFDYVYNMAMPNYHLSVGLTKI